MSEIRCTDVLAWLRSAARADHLLASPTVRAHIGGCRTCQAALLVLARELATPRPPAPISCQQCREDLPAYLECDQPAEAMRAYPEVWWHLATCAGCAETAQLTGALLEAEHAGALPPLRRALLARRQLLVRLPHQFLKRALPAAGPMRGGDAGRQVLSRRATPTGHAFTLSVERQPNQSWSLRAEFRPPLAGWLVLTLGSAEFRAPLDQQGNALLSELPAELLDNASGPDLLLELEQNDE